MAWHGMRLCQNPPTPPPPTHFLCILLHLILVFSSFFFFSSLECKIEANYFILSSYFKVVPPNSFWNTNRFNSHVFLAHFLAHESQIKERTLVFLYIVNNGNFIERRTPLEFVISNDGIHSFKRKKVRFFEKLILKRYSYPINILIQNFKLLDNTPKYNLYIFL